MRQEEIIAALLGAGGASPAISQGLDAAFAMPPEQLQRLAGDVIPLPITPGPNAGPTNTGTVLDAYRSGAPNVKIMPPSTFEDYLKRLLSRQK